MSEPRQTSPDTRIQRRRETGDWRFFFYFGLAFTLLPVLLFVVTALREDWILLPMWVLMSVGGAYWLRESKIMRAIQSRS